VIRFTLVCEAAHSFESWFRDGAAYDEQRERGLLTCPACGSLKVEKAIMAPQVARKDREAAPREPASEASAPAPVALLTPEQTQLRTKLRELRELMTQNSDNVGDKFAQEARRMHFGEIEHRAIHGEANHEEVSALLEDGVEVMPLPGLPEDRN
jgi:hypothetical protein